MTDRELIRAIVEHIEQVGYPPTVAWLADRFSRSSATVHARLKACVRRGLIEIDPHQSRAIRVLEVPE